MLQLTASRLTLSGPDVLAQPAGDLFDALVAHLAGEGPPGLVLLGRFGSGKTTLCGALAMADRTDVPPCTAVPLRVVARHPTLEQGLAAVVGTTRLRQARDGDRVLLLDGLDEVAHSEARSFPDFFEELTSIVGPRWVLTSRPGHFRTDPSEPEQRQIDVLDHPGVRLLQIDDLPLSLVRAEIGHLRGGKRLLGSVEGLEELATSPLLLTVVHAALPHIDSGKPIQPWGVFDAWVRYALASGPDHDGALAALEALAWDAFQRSGYTAESACFSPHEVHALDLPNTLRALFVSDLDGRLRFGHRSLYEFFCAGHMAPRLHANQGHGPDALTGLRLSDAMRVFVVGRAGRMQVTYQGNRVRIPRGNFIAGGDNSADERPLRIEHLDRPVWVAREPVTNAEWARYLQQVPDQRVDANYLTHWGTGRTLPPHRAEEPVQHIWPEDADAYAAWAHARLPSADEWEKAVRGIDGRRWPWGDYWKPGYATSAETGLDRPLPVHAFGAHGDAGLFSAIGGVFEYTSSPWRGHPNRGRVVMGGSYTHPYTVSRAGLRLSHKLSGHLRCGMRLAWDAE